MKFTIEVMGGFGRTVLEGELTAGTTKNKYDCTEQAFDDDTVRKAAFAIEKVINQHTELRCHIHMDEE